MMLTKWVVGNIILKPTMAIVLFILGILKLERCFMMQRGTGVNVLKVLSCVLQLRLRFLRGPCCKPSILQPPPLQSTVIISQHFG